MPLQPWDVDPAHCRIGFSARHLMLAKVRGRFTRWHAILELDEDEPGRSRIEVLIEAASLDTGDQLRDEHLRSDDFLRVSTHPQITFVGTNIQRLDSERFELTGDLTIVGTTRPVTLEVEYAGKTKDARGGGERARFSARTSVNRKDWRLGWNAALEAGGVLVGEKVAISIELSLVRHVAA